MFHLLVLLEDSNLTIEDVEKTLKRRMKNDWH
jgi:phosphoribosyl-ATP pyrophosphohydrolase